MCDDGVNDKSLKMCSLSAEHAAAISLMNFYATTRYVLLGVYLAILGMIYSSETLLYKEAVNARAVIAIITTIVAIVLEDRLLNFWKSTKESMKMTEHHMRITTNTDYPQIGNIKANGLSATRVMNSVYCSILLVQVFNAGYISYKIINGIGVVQ